MKPKTRKMGETRAVYRVKPERAIKPRLARPRARPIPAPVVAWEDRIAPTNDQLREWDAWLNEHEPEFEEKYPGQFLAIWDKQIIAAARSRRALYRIADQVRPNVIPLITYVPLPPEIFIVPSVFPVEWLAKADRK